MTNFKNTVSYLVTSKTTAPAPAPGTGTIVTTGTAIVGTGTKFQSLGELQRGAYIVDIANDEIRIVDSVQSDTEATLREAFSSDLSSATPSIISSLSMNIRTISVGILSGLADGEVDGHVFANGKSYTYSKGGDPTGNFNSFQEPLIIDGTGTSMDVVINR